MLLALCSLLHVFFNRRNTQKGEGGPLFIYSITLAKQRGRHVCTHLCTANTKISVGLAERNCGTVHFFVSLGFPARRWYDSSLFRLAHSCSPSPPRPSRRTYLLFFLSLPASLPVSPMLSILSLADSIIREWYIGGRPLCHARCLRAALRSVSPLSNSAD